MFLGVVIANILLFGSSEGQERRRIEDICGDEIPGGHHITMNTNPVTLILNSRIEEPVKCHLKLFVPSEHYGFSVTVKKLNLSGGSDCGGGFLQFGRPFLYFASHKSKKFCNSDGSKSNQDSSFQYIESKSKELDMWLFVAPSHSHRELFLTVNPFKKTCTSTDRWWRMCPSDNRCVRRDQWCDGVVHCQNGGEDEDETTCNRESNTAASVHYFYNIPLLIIAVFSFIIGIVLLGAIIKLILKCRHRDSQTQNNSPSMYHQKVNGASSESIPSESQASFAHVCPFAPFREQNLPSSHLLPLPSSPSAPLSLTPPSTNRGPILPSYNEVIISPPLNLVYHDKPPAYQEHEYIT